MGERREVGRVILGENDVRVKGGEGRGVGWTLKWQWEVRWEIEEASG